MTLSPGSPEPASPLPDQARDEYLRSVAEKNTAQAAGIRTRNLVIAILGGALVLAFGLIVYLGLSFKNSGERSARSSDATLAIARGFQCQVTPTAKGCPPVQHQAQSAQAAAVDAITYRIESFIAAELGKLPPPKPPDVP